MLSSIHQASKYVVPILGMFLQAFSVAAEQYRLVGDFFYHKRKDFLLIDGEDSGFLQIKLR